MGKLRPLKGPALLDRMHWSEDVYNPHTRLGDHDRWVLEGWLMAHGCVVIRCQPPLETCLENCANDSEELNHEPERIKAVYDGYKKPWKSALEVYDYDYTAGGEAPVFNLLDAHESWTTALGMDVVGIGSPVPKWVFVGERHNPKNLARCMDPTVFRSTSGDYLRRSLGSAKLPSRDYFVTNAYLENGDFNGGLYTVVDGAMVVPMGRPAQKALANAGIATDRYVPHPQWWRRFKNKHHIQYGNALRRGEVLT